ncbi:hypothetical protein HMPREF0063_10757 [Aeromicrobium marinum DSM 15272]|uniref:PD-(D/E)XK endonuclease-like domain-containing protein n=1 Tax=Aeromicrobium marinum DSM 15272 TaxID=585531 RepID=E2S9W7_9ACTN|nr:RecB family exonuclease [Aeromicrobium marinum]EFQ84041.1 hypothetical protein HMPREF0063_10757 [Aeromicrobium marinum DSM 15272]
MDDFVADDPTPAVFRARLSPSRAGDFQTCPLLFRFRTIDRLPEPASPVMARGTLVHAVLEHLYDAPAEARTLEAATAMLPDAWQTLQAEDERLQELFDAGRPDDQAAWLASAAELLGSYFALEDPTRLEPAARELRVEHVLDDAVTLGGIVDRLDVAPDGRIRIVDYKTGRSPDPRFEASALFQMKFYALVVWRSRGVLPTLLQLMYLGDRQVLQYTPTESDLLATERKVRALWDAITASTERREFRPRRSALCGFCAHQSLCPEWGGTPPPLPLLQIEGPVASGEQGAQGVGGGPRQ